jgi:hypothetical protein
MAHAAHKPRMAPRRIRAWDRTGASRTTATVRRMRACSPFAPLGPRAAHGAVQGWGPAPGLGVGRGGGELLLQRLHLRPPPRALQRPRRTPHIPRAPPLHRPRGGPWYRPVPQGLSPVPNASLLVLLDIAPAFRPPGRSRGRWRCGAEDVGRARMQPRRRRPGGPGRAPPSPSAGSTPPTCVARRPQARLATPVGRVLSGRAGVRAHLQCACRRATSSCRSCSASSDSLHLPTPPRLRVTRSAARATRHGFGWRDGGVGRRKGGCRGRRTARRGGGALRRPGRRFR